MKNLRDFKFLMQTSKLRVNNKNTYLGCKSELTKVTPRDLFGFLYSQKKPLKVRNTIKSLLPGRKTTQNTAVLQSKV